MCVKISKFNFINENEVAKAVTDWIQNYNSA